MENMVLYQRLMDFSEWLFPIVDRFPRREKFALCTQIKNSAYALIRLFEALPMLADYTGYA